MTSSRYRRSSRSLAGVALVAVGLLGATLARAANELCGQTITQDLTLTADQTCPDDGLIVKGSITVDLGGFTLQGTSPGSIGIFVEQANTLTIKNGTIRGFTHGMIASAPEVNLSNLVVRENLGAGATVTARSAVVKECSFIDNSSGGLGIGLFTPGATALVTKSAFIGNAVSGMGILANTSTGATITNVIAMANDGPGMSLSANRGPVLNVQRSTIAGNAAEGIDASSFDGGSLTFTKNTIVGNGTDGIGADGTVTITGNLIAGNGQDGIGVRDDADGSVITKNRIVGNRRGGVAVDELANAVVVSANKMLGNGRFGIRSDGSGATLAKNVADANGVYGILTFGSVVDGGGNRARWNADEQCTGQISCPAAFIPKSGPVNPTCGMHVTTSIKLGADTPLCAGMPGLIVDADGVTIDLNGHVLQGDGSTGNFGIDVQGHRGVTIKNGVVRGFDHGIFSPTSDGLKIKNVLVRDSSRNGARVDGRKIAISKSAFVTNLEDGIHFGEGTSSPRISDTFLVSNGDDGVEAHASDAIFKKISAVANVGAGAVLGGPTSAVLQNSLVTANDGDGIEVAFSLPSATIVKNTVYGNQRDGIVSHSAGSGITVKTNVGGGNGGSAIAVRGTSTQNAIVKNTLVGNGVDGIFIDTNVGVSTVVANRALGNRRYGVAVDTPASTLKKNLAVGNDLFGIITPFGAIDGGGNVAFDNAVGQCGTPLVCQ